MTAHNGRGQGDQPLYEGVVLPANGDPWTPEQQRQVDRSHGQPLSGQPWGQPWGPESQAAVTSGESAPSLPAPPPAGPAPSEQLPPAAAPSPGPYDGQGYYGSAEQTHQTHQTHQHQHHQHQTYQQPEQQQPQPHSLSQSQPQPQPQPLHQPQQPPAGPSFAHGGDAGHAFPPVQDASASFGVPAAAPQGAVASSASDATQYIPPVTDDGPHPGHYQPNQAPPMADAAATQMLPPQTGQAPVHGPESTAQLRNPLPPEAPAGGQGGQQQGRPAQPPAGFESLFRSEPSSGSGGSGEPGSTQSLPLFDNAVARQRKSGGVGGLGRSGGAGGPGGSGATGGPGGTYGQGPGGAQSGQQPGEWGPQGRAARRNAERSAISRISPGVLIAVGVAVVASVGMAAGAALTGGGDEEKKRDSGSSAAPASEKSAAPDPVEAQAKELDKLLADSNNSRATVINSVENIKSCKKLGESARDLRAAAGQRNGLVTRLGGLKTDKIPAEAQLKSALTRAWKASASADSHYATWADQTAGKKGCRKGKARTTPHVGLGARSSGEATAAKKQAAGLWNPTAQKYGLKQRQVGQL